VFDVLNEAFDFGVGVLGFGEISCACDEAVGHSQRFAQVI
jgi:hypothetical protein